MTNTHFGAAAAMAVSELAWSIVPIAYLSKLVTVMPAPFAADSMACAIASGNRSLRARMAMLVTSGAFSFTIAVRGSVSVSLGVKVPNRYL